MHANYNGRGVCAITVHVVGEVAITIAVNGGVHVIRVLDERIKGAV